MKGTLNEGPTSFHLSRKKYEQMVAAGWNKTVLTKLDYEINGKKYKLP